jgi:prolyl-tRNA synthetase
MYQSKLFPETKREAPKGAESINHQLLVRAGFIDQLMAGSWTLLPLGFRVVTKINNIIREELNAIGAQELLMPLLHPKSIWNETGRWDKADEVMYKLKTADKREFALSFTHEEIMMDLLRKYVSSYQDLPIALYHFSTKFRKELRATSGILRGREFMMNDLYSAHATQADLDRYYEIVKEAYSKIFTRLGFDFKITEAAGGVFTENRTHEFQIIAPGGEDTIYYCDNCRWGANKEVFEGQKGDNCPECNKAGIKESKSIEVGNIFRYGTWYAERMNALFTNQKGKKVPMYYGAYGIGSTRILGTWVEVSHDQKGIIWNKALTPFDVHLLDIRAGERVDRKAEEIYQKLNQAGLDILYDDRAVSAGEKFADCDLIGIPIRLLISDKTGKNIEWKERDKEKTENLKLEAIIKKLSRK